MLSSRRIKSSASFKTNKNKLNSIRMFSPHLFARSHSLSVHRAYHRFFFTVFRVYVFHRYIGFYHSNLFGSRSDIGAPRQQQNIFFPLHRQFWHVIWNGQSQRFLFLVESDLSFSFHFKSKTKGSVIDASSVVFIIRNGIHETNKKVKRSFVWTKQKL